jgi:phosphatidate cytidylyltransferase
VVAVAVWEWGRLAHFSPLAWLIFAAAMLLTLGTVITGRMSPAVMHVVVIAAMVWWVIAALWVLRYQAATAAKIRPWRGLLAGWLVLAPAFVSLWALHGEPAYGPRYVLFLLVLIWSADSGAYFAGRRFGRRKLAPQVSPGKTWEGVAGGVATSALVAVIGGRMLGLPGESLLWFIPLCLVVVVFSIVGDLLESLFKRDAGVKDSGRFLPGHGGALDRIDSLTAAAPAFYLGLTLFEWPA